MANLFQKGIQAFQAGQIEDALICFRTLARQEPRNLSAWNALGNILGHTGDAAGAVAAYRHALAINAAVAEIHYNLAGQLRGLGDPDGAEKHYREAIRHKPQWPDAHNNLGSLLLDRKRWDDAAAAFQQAIALNAGYAEAWNNLGVCCYEKGDWSGATHCYQRAVMLNPRYVDAWVNGAWNQFAQGDAAGAIACYRQALSIDPAHAQAENALGLAMLSRGEWTPEAWKHYEARWKLLPVAAVPHCPFPLWEGQPLAGKSLLLWSEQGHGDNLMMFRYADILAEQGARVTVQIVAPLLELCRRHHDRISVVEVPAGPFDYQCSMMGLLRALHMVPGAIAAPLAYLQPRSDPRPPSLSPGLRHVGVVWAGNANHVNDTNRSLSHFRMLAPLLAIPGLAFHSLQKGGREDECREFGVPQPAKSFKDFDDTAAFVQHLDLVITVDTSVVHLAGALGKPTWLLLPFVPEWRWYPYGETTPWYPSARLFVQKRRGDWDEVIVRLEAALRELAARPGASE